MAGERQIHTDKPVGPRGTVMRIGMQAPKLNCGAPCEQSGGCGTEVNKIDNENRGVVGGRGQPIRLELPCQITHPIGSPVYISRPPVAHTSMLEASRKGAERIKLE